MTTSIEQTWMAAIGDALVEWLGGPESRHGLLVGMKLAFLAPEWTQALVMAAVGGSDGDVEADREVDQRLLEFVMAHPIRSLKFVE